MSVVPQHPDYAAFSAALVPGEQGLIPISPGRSVATARLAPPKARLTEGSLRAMQDDSPDAIAVQRQLAGPIPAHDATEVADEVDPSLLAQHFGAPHEVERMAALVQRRVLDSGHSAPAKAAARPILSRAQLAVARERNLVWHTRLGFAPDVFGGGDVGSDAFALAVAKQQHAHGLRVDGIAGPKTCAAVGAVTRRASPVVPAGGVADSSVGSAAGAPTAVTAPHSGSMPTRDAVTIDAPKEVEETRATLDVGPHDEQEIAVDIASGTADLSLGTAASAPSAVPSPTRAGPMRTQAAVSIDAPKEYEESRATLAVASVQTRSQSARTPSDTETRGIAARGVAGPGGPLPFADDLAIAFGWHADALTGVRAHVGPAAATASHAIGAAAYTAGTDIAFASAPTRELVAHEAAHVVQQKAGVALAGGVGAAGDPYEQHADAVGAAFARGESVARLLDLRPGAGGVSIAVQRAPAHGTAAPATAPAPPAATPAPYSAPDRIDFGEIVVGERATQPVFVFNTDPTYEAQVSYRLVGAPELVLMSRPTRLRPSHEGVGTPAEILFQPTERTVANAALVVSLAWQMGVHPEVEFRIPIVAKAYAHGERSHADEDAANADAAATSAEHRKEDSRRATSEHAMAENAKDPAQYNPGHREGLEASYKHAMTAMTELTAKQVAGVTGVRGETASFKRAKPATDDDGVLFDLAMFAIDMATAGIAGAIGASIQKRMGVKVKMGGGGTLTNGVQGPATSGAEGVEVNSKEVIAFVSDSLKQGFKDAGKSVRKATFGSGGGGAPEGPRHGGGGGQYSGDAQVNFFTSQEVALADSAADRGGTIIDAEQSLLPVLRQAPDAAIGAMQAIGAALSENLVFATVRQMDASRAAWMRFLSQSALGAVSPERAAQTGLTPGPDGESLTNLAPANVPPAEHRAPRGVDGLLELIFEADYNDPQAPVQLTRVHTSGTSVDSLRGLMHGAKVLRDVPVAMRAQGSAAGVAAFRVTVLRDEAGNLQFTDDVSPDGQTSWLSRKGGALRMSPERQRLGAQALMEELLRTPPPKDRDAITTDSEEKS